MPDEFVDDDHDGTVSALRHAARAEQWAHLAGTGAAARVRSERMRRTRYAVTAGSALAVTGVAVLVASAFGGGGTPRQASPDAAGTRTTAPAGPRDQHDPHNQHGPAKAPATSATTATTTTTAAGKRTMAYYYDRWKTCPDSDLTVNQPSGDVHLPATSSKVWRDACHRMVATLSALNPGADVSPAPAWWQHLPDPRHNMAHILGRNDPVPGEAIPGIGPAVYRIEDAKGTVVLAFHAYDYHESDPWDGGTQVDMVEGLRAWLVPPKAGATGEAGGGEFYVENAKNADAYVLLMEAPAGYTADDFKALVTNPTFEHMMAANLAEPTF
jgi:hypothetical protein